MCCSCSSTGADSTYWINSSLGTNSSPGIDSTSGPIPCDSNSFSLALISIPIPVPEKSGIITSLVEARGYLLLTSCQTNQHTLILNAPKLCSMQYKQILYHLSDFWSYLDWISWGKLMFQTFNITCIWGWQVLFVPLNAPGTDRSLSWWERRSWGRDQPSVRIWPSCKRRSLRRTLEDTNRSWELISLMIIVFYNNFKIMYEDCTEMQKNTGARLPNQASTRARVTQPSPHIFCICVLSEA